MQDCIAEFQVRLHQTGIQEPTPPIGDHQGEDVFTMLPLLWIECVAEHKKDKKTPKAEEMAFCYTRGLWGEIVWFIVASAPRGRSG